MTTALCWFELLADDPARAADALTALLGGAVVGDDRYRAVQVGGRAQLGVLPTGEAGSAPHWIAHLHTDDVDACCRRIAFLQGELVEPPTAAGDHTTALVLDPGGAALAPTTAGADADAFGLLAAPRPDLAARTYKALVDWRIDDPTEALPVFKARSRRVGALWETESVEPQWLPCVAVDDLDAVVDRAERVLLAPTTLKRVGRVAVVAVADVAVGVRASG